MQWKYAEICRFMSNMQKSIYCIFYMICTPHFADEVGWLQFRTFGIASTLYLNKKSNRQVLIWSLDLRSPGCLYCPSDSELQSGNLACFRSLPATRIGTFMVCNAVKHPWSYWCNSAILYGHTSECVRAKRQRILIFIFEGITTCNSPQYTKWFEQLRNNWSPIIP